MPNYLLSQPSAKTTPQSAPIPGRENVMEQNNAGGFAFTADMWTRFERFLILGSEGGTYYVGESKFTSQNIDNVKNAITADGRRAVRMIVEVSKAGRAPKNDQALYALALCASNIDPKTREFALEALPEVARIGTHLFMFASFIDTMRGWGPALRHAVADWYLNKSVDKLGYQLVKYQQRDGWSHRDLFRLSHVEANSAVSRWLFGAPLDAPREVARYVGKEKVRTDTYARVTDTIPEIIVAFEQAKRAGGGACPFCAHYRDRVGYTTTTCEDCGGSGVIKADIGKLTSLIRKHGLTREMIPTESQKHPAVWAALLEKMPPGALLRVLGRMSADGLLTPLSDAARDVCFKLLDTNAIRKARVHPIAFLQALLTYSQGHGDKGNLSWTPVPQVIQALNEGFYSAFASVVPTMKRFYVGVDISGSMGSGTVAGMSGLTPNMGAAAMAMLIARTEPNHFIGGFSHQFIDLMLSPADRLDDAMRKCQGNYGSTDTSVAIRHALDRKYPVDAFVVITDGETWAGNIHTSQALDMYRQRMGINAKLIVMNMVANRTSVSDPSDPGSLDVVGFDASVPAIISGFVGGQNTINADDE